MCSHQGHSSSSFQKACHTEMIPVLLALTSLRLFVIFKQCLSRYSLCSIRLCVKIENEQLKQENIEPQSATIEAKNSVIKLQGDRELTACKSDKLSRLCHLLLKVLFRNLSNQRSDRTGKLLKRPLQS